MEAPVATGSVIERDTFRQERKKREHDEAQ